jgi:hypothetical protein
MGQVSITADVWSDQNCRPFLAMTAHWIAQVEGTSALQLETALIVFHRLHGRHNGKTLAETIVKLLNQAQITVKVSYYMTQQSQCTLLTFLKVGHFTLDNARNNGTMMHSLETMLRDRDIVFNAVNRKVMCFAHVIDLSSGQVTRSTGTQRRRNTVDDDGDDSPQSDDETAISDPIARGRNVVRVIRGSGMRREMFKEVIENGNNRGWFKAGQPPLPVKIKVRQLLRDVCTQWDSTYHMLNRLHEMSPAIDYFLALPNNSELAKYQISPQDWNVMQDIKFVLSVSHKSGYEMYPDSRV